MDNKQSSGDKSEQIADIVKGTSKLSNIKQLANTFLMLLVLLVFAGASLISECPGISTSESLSLRLHSSPWALYVTGEYLPP